MANFCLFLKFYANQIKTPTCIQSKKLVQAGALLFFAQPTVAQENIT